MCVRVASVSITLTEIRRCWRAHQTAVSPYPALRAWVVERTANRTRLGIVSRLPTQNAVAFMRTSCKQQRMNSGWYPVGVVSGLQPATSARWHSCSTPQRVIIRPLMCLQQGLEFDFAISIQTACFFTMANLHFVTFLPAFFAGLMIKYVDGCTMQMVLLLLFTKTTLKNRCKQTETNHFHTSVDGFRKSYARCNASRTGVAFGHS